jgi:hypothetical protein
MCFEQVLPGILQKHCCILPDRNTGTATFFLHFEITGCEPVAALREAMPMVDVLWVFFS